MRICASCKLAMLWLIGGHLGAAGSTGAANPGEDQSLSPAGGAFLAASAGLHENVMSVHVFQITARSTQICHFMRETAGVSPYSPCIQSQKKGSRSV